MAGRADPAEGPGDLAFDLGPRAAGGWATGGGDLAPALLLVVVGSLGRRVVLVLVVVAVAEVGGGPHGEDLGAGVGAPVGQR